MLNRTFIVVPLLIATAAARGEDFEVEPDQVLVTALATVGGKQISAVSHSLQWSAVALDGESAQVRLRLPIASFDSGHPAIDALLRAAAGGEPVEISGVVRSGRFEGTLLLHGASRRLSMPVNVARIASQLAAHAAFEIDLADFGIAVPQLGRRVRIEFNARLRATPNAVLAGGSVN